MKNEPTRLPDVVESIRSGLIYYFLTTGIVAIGLVVGSGLSNPFGSRGYTFNQTNEAYANWDGQWYVSIATQGYRFEDGKVSSVAFFPGYPVIGAAFGRMFHIQYDLAMLIVANLTLAMSFILAAHYLAITRADSDPRLSGYVLMSMGLFPPSFFFRMAYSEGLFLLILLAVLHLLNRGKRLFTAAFLIGLATATRALGVALIPALVVVAYKNRRSSVPFARFMVILLPLSCWGLFAYLTYLQFRFHNAFAFAAAQESFRIRPPTTLLHRFLSLISFEPIRALYDANGEHHWSKISGLDNPFLSIRSADPVYFMIAAALTIVGAFKRWLTHVETLTSAFLLLIPYVTIGYEQYMQSMARYSAAAAPIYIVMGVIFCKIPPSIVGAIAGICGMFMGLYAALFSAWYVII